MKAIITDVEALSSISTLSIHAYLKSQSWSKGDDLGERGVIYTSHGGAEIFAPGSDRLGDYPQSVAAVLEMLSVAEERDELSVFRDLAVADRDVVRFRALEAFDDGSVTLNTGVDLVQQSRDAILAAACSAADPRRFYRSGRNSKANEYLDTVKLGQTEHGSFVVTVHSPVPPNLENGQQSLWPEFYEEPFSRQVTRTFRTAVEAMVTAIAEVSRGGNIEAFERVVAKGVSANLCLAISKFVKDGEGLDVSLTWARTRPSPEPRFRSNFATSDADVLSEAAKVLRNKESFRNEVLEGFVVGLNRDVKPQNGRVKLKAFVDGQVRSVTVELPADLYTKALDAHDAKAEVRLEGDLEFEGQRYYLRSPRNLQIVEVSDGE